MSLVVPIGSVIPDSVLSDVASFFHDTQLRTFGLLSPRAHALTEKNRLIMVDWDRLTLKLEANSIHMETWSERNRTTSFVLKSSNKEDLNERFSGFLSKCRSIKDIQIDEIDLDEMVIKKLLKIKIGEINVKNCEVKVGYAIYLEFLRNMKVNLINVQVSNELLTDESMKLVSTANVFRSWNNVNPNIENCATTVSKEFLFPWEITFPKRPFFNFRGFLTNFTVGFIRYYEYCFAGNDFGILGYEQLSQAIRYSKMHNHEEELRCWNGQKTIYFHVYEHVRGYDSGEVDAEPDLYFSVSLSENLSGPVLDATLPTNVVPAEEFALFNKYTKILNDPGNLLETEEVDRSHISSLKFSYITEAKKGTMLKIRYEIRGFYDPYNKENELPKPIDHVLIKTSVDLSQVYQIIVNLLSTCSSISTIEFRGVDLTDELFTLLKPIAVRVEIKYSWRINFDLSPVNFLEMVNMELFQKIDFKANNYLSKAWLTNEDLVHFIERKFNIPGERWLKKDNSYDNPLNDDLLRMLATKVTELPAQFSFKCCQTMFSAKGIKELLKALQSRSGIENTCHYSLGVIDENNVDEVAKLVQEHEDANDGTWLIKREKTIGLPESCENTKNASCMPDENSLAFGIDDQLNEKSTKVQLWFHHTAVIMMRGSYSKEKDNWQQQLNPSYMLTFDFPTTFQTSMPDRDFDWTISSENSSN